MSGAGAVAMALAQMTMVMTMVTAERVFHGHGHLPKSIDSAENPVDEVQGGALLESQPAGSKRSNTAQPRRS